jgi:hypothetical protein
MEAPLALDETFESDVDQLIYSNFAEPLWPGVNFRLLPVN